MLFQERMAFNISFILKIIQEQIPWKGSDNPKKLYFRRGYRIGIFPFKKFEIFFRQTYTGGKDQTLISAVGHRYSAVSTMSVHMPVQFYSFWYFVSTHVCTVLQILVQL